VWIKKSTEADFGEPKHKHLNKGQHLPNIPNRSPGQMKLIKHFQNKNVVDSFYLINYVLKAGETYDIKLAYRNLFSINENDIDGCTLFLYGGDIN
jgi:hypothetical protein